MKIKPTINIYIDPVTVLYIGKEYEVSLDLATFLSDEGWCEIVLEEKSKKNKQLDEKSA